METIQLKFLLKLLGNNTYHLPISQIKLTKASQRDKICRDLAKHQLINYTEEIAKIKITPSGKALLKLEESKDKLTQPELKILQTCQKEAISPSQTKITPTTTRQELINKLITQGLITSTTTNIKEVWLTDKGKQYLAQEYQPTGAGNITLSKNLLADYLNFLRQHLSTTQSPINTTDSKPTDEEILQTIINLDKQNNTNNYLPIFHLRNQLQPPLSREEIDSALYRLQASDKIELSTLAEVEAYTIEQINTGIAQPVGGSLFFIILNS